MRCSRSTALFCFFILFGSPGLAIRLGGCVGSPTRVPCRLLWLASSSIVGDRTHFLLFPCRALQNYRGPQHWASDAPCSCSQRHSLSRVFLRTISSRLFPMNWRT